jgi:alpha-tubulin suppressor-like RCC1 family protein
VQHNRLRILATTAFIATTILIESASTASAQTAGGSSHGAIAFSALTAGDAFSCGLSQQGRAYCWGAGYEGQLGIDGVVAMCADRVVAPGACARAPVPVAGDHQFVALAAGTAHACGIDVEGVAYCWGENHFRQLGVLGELDGCVVRGPNLPVAATRCSRKPVRVPSATRFTAIGAGKYFTCALDDAARAWCWGFNGDGSTPALVPLDQRLVSLAVAGDQACGLATDSTARCWSWPEVLTKGVRAPSGDTKWAALTLAAAHACALDAEGQASCWGNDADGALGIGPGTHVRFADTPPTPVIGNHRFRAIAASTTRTCAIDLDGALFCWGRVREAVLRTYDRCLDSNGFAGTNDCTSHPVLVHGRTSFRAVALGEAHRCAISTTGAVFCWGENDWAQLGNGSRQRSDELATVRIRGVTPVQIQLIDARERIAQALARGGFALLVLIGLFVQSRRWMATRSMPHLVGLWVGAIALTALLRALESFGVARGFGSLVRAAAVQPPLIVLGVTAYRLWVRVQLWWREGVQGGAVGGTAPSLVLAPSGGVPPQAIDRNAGAGSILAVLIGWALFGFTLWSARGARGEIEGGLAMLAMLNGFGAAVLGATVGAIVGIVILRRSRSAKLARIGLTLSLVTLLAASGIVVSFYVVVRS